MTKKPTKKPEFTEEDAEEIITVILPTINGGQ